MFTTILLLAVGLVSDDWYTFEPGSKTFRIAMPAMPSSTTSQSATGSAGSSRLTTAQAKTADGVYSVQATENLAKVNPGTLDEGIRQFAASRKATLGPLQSITVDGDPGFEFEMTEGAKRSRLRFVASGNTLFVLSVSGMPGSGVPAEADRFLGSLEVGPARASASPAPGTETTEAEEARVLAEIARAKLVAELARAKAEAELAKVRAKAETARVKAETEHARVKAKSKAEFSDAPDGSMTLKALDDPKDAGISSARKSNAPLKLTISRTPKNAKPYADQDIEDVSGSFAGDLEGFRDIGPEGSVLVGVRVTFIERDGASKVRSAQPIFRSGTSHYEGQVHGEVVGPVMTVVARPGYAVGGLVTHNGLTLDGFGIVFMKVDGDRLDSNDIYNSPWIGDRQGGSPGGVTTKGGLVVGLQGTSKTEVIGLGLISRK